MKKVLLSIVTALSVFTLVACGGKEENKLVVGASNVPHAVILEKAQPILEKKGIKLEIKNSKIMCCRIRLLADKEIDANYFQHIPYLDKEIQEKGYKIVNAGKIHLEPMGIYSKKYKSLKDLPDGGTVIMSNNVAERGRMLALLQKVALLN